MTGTLCCTLFWKQLQVVGLLRAHVEMAGSLLIPVLAPESTFARDPTAPESSLDPGLLGAGVHTIPAAAPSEPAATHCGLRA